MPRVQIPNPKTGRLVYIDTPTGKKLLELYRNSPQARKVLRMYVKENAKAH